MFTRADFHIDENVEYCALTESISFALESTESLNEYADERRKKLGLHPMFDSTDKDYDMDGWYNFYFCIFKDGRIMLSFVVDGSSADDDGREYEVDLSDLEKVYLFQSVQTDCLCIYNEPIGKIMEREMEE